MDETNKPTSSVPRAVVPPTITETPATEPSSHDEPEVGRVLKPEAEALLKGQGDVDESGTTPTDEIRILPADGTEPEMARVQLRVYRQRWVVLAVVALLNHVNCVAWIAFAPVANYVDDFYHFTGATNWFSMVYMIVTVPVGIFAMWAGRFFGLRAAILIAAWSNALGVGIRLTSSFLPQGMMFPVGLAGQAIAATAYPFIMFLPTKVAGSWFGANQRGLATTIGVMANPLGVLLSNLISPQLVKEPNHVLYLNIIVAILSTVVCIMATIGVTRSEPKTPPTLSAAQQQMQFFEGLKTCFTNKQYLILLVVMGAGIGMFNCLYTILQQLLCPYGYENWLSGLCAAMMIIGGVIGATASGIFVDRTRRYTETMKVSMVLAVVFGLTFLQLSQIRHIPYFILLACFFFGVMGLAMYPVGLEMSAECTFPVTETTSTGLVVLCGQVQAVLFMAIMTAFAKPMTDTSGQACGDPLKAKNMSTSILIVSGFAAFMAFFLAVFFKPVYKRMNAEKGIVEVRTEGTKDIELVPVDTTIQNAPPPTA